MALDGTVTVTWGEGWRYEGNQVGGQFSGAGVLTNPVKDRFKGSWVGGKMNGQGTLVRSDGERYDGLWKDDLPDGEGTLMRADGSVVKGVFRDGKLEDASLDAPQIAKKDELKKSAGRSGLCRHIRQDADRCRWLAHCIDPDRWRHRAPDH